MTFVTIDITKMRYKYSPIKSYDNAIKHRTLILNDRNILRHQSMLKQAELRRLGKTFTPMINQDLNKNIKTPLMFPAMEDTIPTSFNLCMLGLNCEDPDDDYPHDVTCSHYHDAYRKREFDENTIIL